MKYIGFLLLFVFFALFAFSLNMENPDEITLRYFGLIEIQTDLYLVLLVPFAIGMILGVILMSISVVKNKVKVGKTNRQLAKVEKEVQNLRAAPITEPMKDEA